MGEESHAVHVFSVMHGSMVWEKLLVPSPYSDRLCARRALRVSASWSGAGTWGRALYFCACVQRAPPPAF